MLYVCLTLYSVTSGHVTSAARKSPWPREKQSSRHDVGGQVKIKAGSSHANPPLRIHFHFFIPPAQTERKHLTKTQHWNGKQPSMRTLESTVLKFRVGWRTGPVCYDEPIRTDTDCELTWGVSRARQNRAERKKKSQRPIRKLQTANLWPKCASKCCSYFRQV
jgi:hypothetical protein